MKALKILKITFGLLLVLAVAIALASINHPIILKWVLGSARFIGKPIKASVFTNGQINDDIKVFHIDRYWDNSGKADNYLLSLTEYDSTGHLKYINIDLKDKWIGIPVGVSKKDYDFIAGHLLQSETGGHFIPVASDTKGFGYEPQLSVNGKEIKFRLLPGELKFDSIRVVLQ